MNFRDFLQKCYSFYILHFTFYLLHQKHSTHLFTLTPHGRILGMNEYRTGIIALTAGSPERNERDSPITAELRKELCRQTLPHLLCFRSN